MTDEPPRPVKITKLAEAIWSIRKCHRMGQVAFAAVIGISSSQISRYESGLTKPEVKTLLSLLSMAEAPAARRPILQELKRQGVEELLHSIRLSGLLPQASLMHTVCDGQPAEARPQSRVSTDIAPEVTL